MKANAINLEAIKEEVALSNIYSDFYFNQIINNSSEPMTLLRAKDFAIKCINDYLERIGNL